MGHMFGALILLGAFAAIADAIDQASSNSGYSILPSSTTATAAKTANVAIETMQPSAIDLSEPSAIAPGLPDAIGGGGDEYVISDIENHIPISRSELERLLAAGGGIDTEGYFTQAIPLNWGFTPTASTIRFPFAWAPGEAALVTVSDGHYVAIDFETGAY